MGWKVENIGEKLEVVLVQEAWFVAVAVRRSPPFFFCSCPASMNAPGCQLFEFRARKMRYDPSRAILQRAPLNLWIALTPQRFEMVSMLVAFRLSTEPLVPSSKGRFETIQPLSSRSNALLVKAHWEREIGISWTLPLILSASKYFR